MLSKSLFGSDSIWSPNYAGGFEFGWSCKVLLFCPFGVCWGVLIVWWQMWLQQLSLSLAAGGVAKWLVASIGLQDSG